MFIRHFADRRPIAFYLNSDDGAGSGGGGQGGDSGSGGGDSSGSGSGGGDAKKGADGGDAGGSGGDSNSGKTYTQAEVDALDQKLKKRYSNGAVSDLLGELEIGSVDDLKGLLAAEKERNEADMSDAEKAKADAAALEAKAQAQLASATAQEMEFRLKSALLTPGDDAEKEPAVNPERIDGAMAVALSHATTSDETDVAQLIADAVAHTRASVPEVFGSTAGGGKPPKSPGNPNRPANQQGNSDSGDSAADQILAWKKKEGERFKPLVPTSDT